jgi:hypothetical protein
MWAGGGAVKLMAIAGGNELDEVLLLTGDIFR